MKKLSLLMLLLICFVAYAQQTDKFKLLYTGSSRILVGEQKKYLFCD